MDNLRAVLMFFGIIIHTSIFFTPASFYPWPVKNSQLSYAFVYLTLLIHVFRMPLFFLVAGFFAHFIQQRQGWIGFLRNRSWHILLPFLIALLLLNLYYLGSFLSYLNASRTQLNYATLFYFFGSTGSLWFLYYLFMLYLLIFLVYFLWRFSPQPAKQRCRTLFLFLIRRAWHPCILTLPALAVLFNHQQYVILPPLSIIPDLYALFYYFIFFIFGWLLFSYQAEDYIFKKYGWFFVATALLVTFPVYYYLFQQKTLLQQHKVLYYFQTALYPLTAWLLCGGFLGTFQRFFSKENKILRYFADASYWFYLVQVPIIITFQIYYSLQHGYIITKFIYIVFWSTLVMGLSYAVLVRRTFIGVLLNGRRYK